MNTLEQALIDIINTVTNSVGNAKDFVLAEIPEVIRQLLLWHMIESIISMILGILLLAAIPIGWTIIYRKREIFFRKKRCNLDAMSGESWATTIAGTFLTIVLTLLGLNLINLTWLQIWLAPKLYLIEYAAQLVK